MTHQPPRRQNSILRPSNLTSDAVKKHVGFDKVEVKYHKIILGDNPGVSDGAPITIHWKPHHREVMNVDDFEQRISLQKNNAPPQTRRASASGNSSNKETGLKKKDLRISVQDRAMILLKSGYSLEQIGRQTELVQEIQQSRQKSAAASAKWDGINVALENSGKAFKKMIRIDQLLLGNGTSSKNAPVNPAA
jgi:hypothetical protein